MIAIVAGALALLPGLGLLAGGTALAVGQAVATDDGYFTFTPDRLHSDGVAVVADDAWLDDADDGGPWVLDWLDLDVRLRAEATGEHAVFIGIGHADDVAAYLAGSEHSVIEHLDGHLVTYRDEAGRRTITDPADADIWVASAEGAGQQELTWAAHGGRWSAVVMHADGTPDVTADVEVGMHSDAVTPIAVTLIVFGSVITLGSVALIVIGARGRRAV